MYTILLALILAAAPSKSPPPPLRNAIMQLEQIPIPQMTFTSRELTIV